MKNLNRDLVAIRIGINSAYISWKLVENECKDTLFNLYKIAGNGIPVKLTSSPAKGMTSFQDDNVDFSSTNLYFVRALVSGKEQARSQCFPLLGNLSIHNSYSSIRNKESDFYGHSV